MKIESTIFYLKTYIYALERSSLQESNINLIEEKEGQDDKEE